MSSLLLMGAINDLCANPDALEILKFVGWILTFFKVGIPLVIIALGMFDLGKAVVASKDEEIKTQTKGLLRRALAGVFIFFVPALVMFIFEAMQAFNDAADRTGFEGCKTAILKPWQ